MQRPGGPIANQYTVYSGYKRSHCLLYQTITTLDGLIFHMYGPEFVWGHVITLYRETGMDEILIDSRFQIGKQFYLYGDPTYIL